MAVLVAITGGVQLVITIELTPLDILACERIAEIRNDKPASAYNKRITDRTDYQTHLIGAIGEVAFVKATGLMLDTSQLDSGDFTDFEHRGCRIEVKTRAVQDDDTAPDLLCEVNRINSDLYVLAWWFPKCPHKVVLVGYCDKARLMSNQEYIGGNLRYVAKHGQLSQIKRLIKKIKESNEKATGTGRGYKEQSRQPFSGRAHGDGAGDR